MSTLDFSNFQLTFSDEFDYINISSNPQGSDFTWYNRTPWYGDFGSASFAGSDTNGTFQIVDGALSIQANQREDGSWTSGLISSVDPSGEGFAQQFGYFEMRAQLPAGEGLWPAFWLIGLERLDPASTYTAEVDVMEHYGVMPDSYTGKVHVWQRDGSGGHEWAYARNWVEAGELYSGFHTYGVLIEEDYTTFYYDGEAFWRTITPEEHHQPMIILADLALGGGWPIDQAPDGSVMLIDYIRVYAENGDQAAAAPDPTAIRFADLFDLEARFDSQNGLTLEAEAAPTRLVGGIGNDLLSGNVHGDRLAGHKGNDIILGGDGNDQLYGDQHDDALFGGAGKDELYGGGGKDMLVGGAGDDFLNGGGGVDLLSGGEGADRYIIRARDKTAGVEMTHPEAPGLSYAQWVQVHGLDFSEGDKLTFEGFAGLTTAIGRDNIVSNQGEFDALVQLLLKDERPETGVTFDFEHDSIVLGLIDGAGASHVVELYEADFMI